MTAAQAVKLSPAVEARELIEASDRRERYRGVLRFYELAKRAEWQVRDLPWGEVPPIPEYKGSAQKLARRRDLWRSVVTQQLQADQIAVDMAAQLFSIAPDPEAKLYYTTLVQDEARHTEAWLKLADEAGGMAERDRISGARADEARRARDPIGEDVRTHDSGCSRAACHRERQAALRVRERKVDVLLGAGGLDDVPVLR